jgi:uncharacterized membrane-anchored protein
MPLSRLEFHPEAERLYREIHSRPFAHIEPPASVYQLAVLDEGASIEEIVDHIATLHPRLAANTDTMLANRAIYIDLDDFQFRWEKHREFCSYGLIDDRQPVESVLEQRLPVPIEWLGNLPGKLMVATSVRMIPEAYKAIDRKLLKAYFDDKTVIGSHIVDGKASVWTSFDKHRNGFARYVLFIDELSRFQIGRTLQRITEFETYRVMALLGYPLANEIAPRIAEIDRQLQEVLGRLPDLDSLDDERDVLQEISELAVRLEAMRSRTSFRFDASRAYAALVADRLANLRERPYPGVSTMDKFLERRFDPAMRTCESVAASLNSLSERLARSTSLLRTRVEMSIAAQNQQLLESMNRRAHLQLRLGQTVEGLSVAAITYYATGLLEKVFEAMHEAGFPVEPSLLTGFAIVPVAAAVWWTIRRIRQRIDSEE